MGSSGSGRFGNYRISGELDKNEKNKINEGIDSIGGEVECPEIIENIRLEDVATSEYFVKYGNLPTVQSIIKIRDSIYQGRLVAEVVDTNEIIGNLPTQYNYLFNCLKSGVHYNGRVISSGKSPIPFIVVTINA